MRRTTFSNNFSVRKLRSQNGSLLLLAYFVIVVVIGAGAALLLIMSNEARMTERQYLNTIAFHIAEAGLERGFYDLRGDFVNATTTPSWADGDINGYAVPANTASYTSIPYESTSLNGGSYDVRLKNVAGTGEDIWVTSEGTFNDVSHAIEAYVRMVDISPWDYAIFAGSGASGTMINGIVDIRGSVIILGSGLNDGDYAIDIGGTAQLVGNNYATMPSDILAKVPALETVLHDGEWVSTLNATLRVKKGLVGISGNASVGEANITGNSHKETVDSVYVQDGFGGNQGTSGVFSDNGVSNGYDLGDAVEFPSLSTPYQGYATYTDYLRSIAYIVSDDEAAELANVTKSSSFTIGDSKGSITMDGSGNMHVDGVVFIDNGGNLSLTGGKQGTITYTGKGSIYASGNVTLDTNIVVPDGVGSFPTNIVGIMTPNDINMGTSAQIDIMGVFYAEHQVVATKQTDIVGTIVSNYFNMGTNVPAIYQVPETKNNLPIGMIGSGSRWYMIVGWIKR